MNKHVSAIVFLILMSLLRPALIYGEEGQNEQSVVSIIYEEFRRGDIEGEIGLYYKLEDYDKGSFIDEDEIVQLEDTKILVPYFQINYASPTYKGFSLGVGFTGYVQIKKDDESGSIFRDFERFVTHQLYIQYALSETTFKVGRMELEDTIFLTDYYEAFSLTSREIENIRLFLAVIEEVAESDLDVFMEFQDVSGDEETIEDYLYAVEAAWDIVPDAFSSTLYYYHQGNLYDLYGTHSEFFHRFNDITLGFAFDYYETHEDGENGMKNINDEVDDTDIFHINPYLEFEEFSISAGYIEANQNVGAREDDIIDDYFNPFNEGDKVYEPDAKTWYGALGYDRENFAIEIVYGDTEYLDGSQHLSEKEFDITTSFIFKERFVFEAEFARVNSESPEGDFTVLEMALRYEF